MQKHANNERGSVLLFCIVIMMVLTLGSMFALNLTEHELQSAASGKSAKKNFHNAEMGMQYAIANFEPIYKNYGGVDEDGKIIPLYSGGDGGILLDGRVGVGGDSTFGLKALRDMPPDTGFVMFNYVAYNTDPADPLITIPILLARVEIRSILQTENKTIGRDDANQIYYLSEKANDVPLMPHIGPAPDGYEASKYKGRRYAITSTAYNSAGTGLTDIIIQSGTIIAEPTEKVSHYMTY